MKTLTISVAEDVYQRASKKAAARTLHFRKWCKISFRSGRKSRIPTMRRLIICAATVF